MNFLIILFFITIILIALLAPSIIRGLRLKSLAKQCGLNYKKFGNKQKLEYRNFVRNVISGEYSGRKIVFKEITIIQGFGMFSSSHKLIKIDGQYYNSMSVGIIRDFILKNKNIDRYKFNNIVEYDKNMLIFFILVSFVLVFLLWNFYSNLNTVIKITASVFLLTLFVFLGNFFSKLNKYKKFEGLK